MLKLLCCPFSLVLFIYIQSEACWFVGVTWPALIGGFISLPSQAVNPATPSLGVTVLHPQLLPLGILVYPSVALETWGLDHHALFTHFTLANIFSWTRMQMGEDQPKNVFKDWKNILGYDLDMTEMRKWGWLFSLKPGLWVHVWVVVFLCIPPKMQTKPPLAELYIWMSKCYALSTQFIFNSFFVWIFVWLCFNLKLLLSKLRLFDWLFVLI